MTEICISGEAKKMFYLISISLKNNQDGLWQGSPTSGPLPGHSLFGIGLCELLAGARSSTSVSGRPAGACTHARQPAAHAGPPLVQGLHACSCRHATHRCMVAQPDSSPPPQRLGNTGLWFTSQSIEPYFS